MNLHGIVRGAITSVNPDVAATLYRSTGYTTSTSGKQTPSYAVVTGSIQVQHLSGKDLKHAERLNLQGVLRSVYMFGDWQGVVRADEKGGDLLVFRPVPADDLKVWKVVNVAETYPDWCKVLVAMQLDDPASLAEPQ